VRPPKGRSPTISDRDAAYTQRIFAEASSAIEEARVLALQLQSRAKALMATVDDSEDAT
jgi:hypothetical protein